MGFPDDNYTKAQLGGEAYSLLRTYLTAGISATDVVIPVASTANFPDGSSGICTIRIGTPSIEDAEVIRYTSKDDTHFYCDSVSDRGYDGTTAYAHSINNWVNFGYPAIVHNRICETIANIETFIRDELRGGYKARADLGGINQYDVCCLNSVGKFTKANATYLETSYVIGIAPLAILPNEEGYSITGKISNSNWAWNPQKRLWLSTIDGQLSEDKPGVDNYEVYCGRSILPDTILFEIPDIGKIAKL